MTDTLASPEVIRRLAQEYAVALKDPDLQYRGWCDGLVKHLNAISAASEEERASLDFQKTLWDSKVVAETGQGSVSVDGALKDVRFRQWVAKRLSAPLPPDELVELRHRYEELQEKVAAYSAKTPRLKIFRVLASFYPRHFTTIADVGRMARLHEQMLDGRKADEVERHHNVLQRLEEVLGQAPADLEGWVRRMTLPWFLHEHSARAQATPGAQLKPLPAVLRRRGMTTTKGSLDWAMRVLDFVGEGVTREDLVAFLKQEHPGVKDNTIATKVNILRSELNVLEQAGDLLVPTETGRRLVESKDPSALAPFLLTRVFGVDHVIATLREGPVSSGWLVEHLQGAYPNWTTNFAPLAILGWLRAFGVTELDGGRLQLTPRGKEWAALIHWTPEPLAPEEVKEPIEPVRQEEAPIALPPLKDLLARMPKDLFFTDDQVASLHAGLWSHPRRHFAILTGLSGSGKTSLARSYAKALIELTSGPEDVPRRRLPVPVAPGWTDPSPLLGYLNPLKPGEYERTPFLQLLLSCAANPSKIHVAILDEMNLSHPEQYLAPLLSGMEMEDEPLILHGEEDEVDGVPGRLPRYPSNLVLIGTVNMDETTHGLSDKVLDRAITIEFWDIDLQHYPRWGDRGLPVEVEDKVRRVLGDLLPILSPVRLHFGWRVVNDILDFMQRSIADGQLSTDAALDRIVYSKVVPKLRGYQSDQFEKAFATCRDTLARHELKQSAAKVANLLDDLKNTGSARFWR